MNNGRSKKENEDYNQFLIKATNFSLNFLNDLHFNYDNRNLNLSIINPNNVYNDIKKQNTKEFVQKEKDNFKYISSLIKVYSQNSKKIYSDKNKINNENEIQHLIEINAKKERTIKNNNNNNNNNNTIINSQTIHKDNFNNTNSRNLRNEVELKLTNSNDNLNPHFNTMAVIKTPEINKRNKTVNSVSIYSTNQSSLETNVKQPYHKINKLYNKVKIKSPNTSRISGKNIEYILPKANFSFMEDPKNNNTIIINTDDFYKQIQFDNIQHNLKKKHQVKTKCYQKPLIPKVVLPKNDNMNDNLYGVIDNQKHNMKDNAYIKTLREQNKSKYDYVLNFDYQNENKQKSPSHNLNIDNEFAQNREITKKVNKSKDSNKNKKNKKNVKTKEKEEINTISEVSGETQNETSKGNIVEVFLEENENNNSNKNFTLISDEKYDQKDIKSKRNQPYIVSFGNNPSQTEQNFSLNTTQNKPICVTLKPTQENTSFIKPQQSNDFNIFFNEHSDYSKNNIYLHERSDVFGGPTESQADIFSVIKQNSGSLRFSFRPQTPTKCIKKKHKIKNDNNLPKFTTTFINVTLDDEETIHTDLPKMQSPPVKKSSKVKKIKKEKNNLKKRLVFEPD